MQFKKIYVEITNICNMSCKFCVPHHRPAREMSKAEFSHVLNEISPYGRYIYLHVKGEPLAHKNVDFLIEEAFEKGFFVCLTTNGTLLLEHKKIFRLLRQINLSLHATDDYDLVRELKKEENINISLRIWNGENRERTLRFLEDEFAVLLSRRERRQTIRKNIFLSIEEPFEWVSVSDKREETDGYCLGLKQQIAILANGTVTACCLDHEGDINLGNIFAQPFGEIINSERAKKITEGFKSRRAIEQLCGKCTFKKRFDL